MSFKFGTRYRGAFLCMFCLALVQFFLARAVADDAAQKLVLVVLGSEKTSLGNDIPFRVYKAPDGTTGRVDFETLGSVKAAEKQIEEWIKRSGAIKGREHYWNARLELCQWEREKLDKEYIWDEGRSISLSRL